MRRFHSYGPVDSGKHFAVERRALVEQCVTQLVQDPDTGGDYFTIWAPRQTGKTWLMHRAIEEIRTRYGSKFTIGALSIQGLPDIDDDESFLKAVPLLLEDGFDLQLPTPTDWQSFLRIFKSDGGLFDKPLILLIDEFDSLPPSVIDRLVSIFRRMYLSRDRYVLHGLALVGVRSVLGTESERGSPFNVQRSLHIANLTREEVGEMFDQYQTESHQVIELAVVNSIFETTKGRPGLVSWFGELLTEKHNPDRTQTIGLETWRKVFMLACRVEPNNTVLNLIQKAHSPYLTRVVDLFGRPDVPFSFDEPWCNHLYAHGVIDFDQTTDASGQWTTVCRFSCSFVQIRLHAAFCNTLMPHHPILALDPLDTLENVFTPEGINAVALCHRYVDYLTRLRAKGLEPFTGDIRRVDLGLRESVGHFHLYAWLREAVGKQCSIQPEFPTGNGKVDLLLETRDHRAVVEVKSFKTATELVASRQQAVRYAKSQGLTEAVLAVFVPVADETVLEKLSGDEVIDGVRVTTVSIGWT